MLNAITQVPVTLLVVVAGLAAAAYAAVRVLYGLRLSLYLVNGDSVVKDQGLIPVTFSARKRSLLECVRKGAWRDDVELVLMDYQRRAYSVRVTYGLWRHYRLELQEGPEGLRLGHKELRKGRRYRLKSGMHLVAGGRKYEVRVLFDRPDLALQY